MIFKLESAVFKGVKAAPSNFRRDTVGRALRAKHLNDLVRKPYKGKHESQKASIKDTLIHMFNTNEGKFLTINQMIKLIPYSAHYIGHNLKSMPLQVSYKYPRGYKLIQGGQHEEILLRG